MYWKHLWSIVINIFVPFLADYDQNHKQMISLKKLLGCSQFQIIQIFVIVPGVVPYSFLTKRAARHCVLSMSFICFWMWGSQPIFQSRNLWRPELRICILILGLKDLVKASAAHIYPNVPWVPSREAESPYSWTSKRPHGYNFKFHKMTSYT